MHTDHTYLLHFERRYPRGRQPQHYRGSAVDVAERLKEHQRVWAKGRRGAPRAKGDCALLWAMGREGITFRVVQTVPGTRRDERYFKNWGSQRQLCPECGPAERARRNERKRRLRRAQSESQPMRRAA
jgi:hypothetical protein